MIQVVRTYIQNIPLIVVSDDEGPEKRPVVIALHGLSEDKETMLPFAEALAQEGFDVLLPDARLHGERAGNEPVLNDRIWKTFLPIFLGTFDDLSFLITHVSRQARYDNEKIGLLGVSMGGALSLAAMTRHPNIATAVSILTMDSARHFVKHHGLSKLLSPVAHLIDARFPRERLVPRPILMLNGVDDPVVPIQSVRAFVADMTPRYPSQEWFRLIEYPGVGHDVVPDMVEQSRNWLITHLEKKRSNVPSL